MLKFKRKFRRQRVNILFNKVVSEYILSLYLIIWPEQNGGALPKNFKSNGLYQGRTQISDGAAVYIARFETHVHNLFLFRQIIHVMQELYNTVAVALYLGLFTTFHPVMHHKTDRQLEFLLLLSRSTNITNNQLTSDCQIQVTSQQIQMFGWDKRKIYRNTKNKCANIVQFDKRYQLDTTIMICYHKWLYMFRTSICPSSGVQVVYCCMWFSALGVVAVVLRSRCVVLWTYRVFHDFRA